jgi:hypothetical protein
MSLVQEIFCMLVRTKVFAVCFFLLSLGTQIFAQERVKLAEARVRHSDQQDAQMVGLTQDQWTLWRAGDHYEVEDVLKMLVKSGGGEVRTLLRLGPDFRITHVRLEPRNSKRWGGTYDCDVLPLAARGQLRCTYGGALVGEGSIALPFPYVFDTVDDDPPMGIGWTYANVVNAAARTPQKVTSISQVRAKARTDPDGRTRLAEASRETKQVRCLGPDTISIDGQRVVANKWEIVKDMFVWTSEQGLPLQWESDTRERRWVLRGFRQYGPLVAGVPVTESPGAPPVQPLAWQPTFAEAAKLAAAPPLDATRPPAAEAVKVAEGSYGEMDSWILWRVGSQFVLVIDNLVYRKLGGGSQLETLQLDRAFHMKRLRYEARHASFLPDGALDCVVKPWSLDCSSSFLGEEGEGTIRVNGGYATQFGVEVALLDMPWFYTTLTAHGARKLDERSPVGVVSLAFDGQTKETLVTANPQDASIRYRGREPIRVLGKTVSGHKYEIAARDYDATVWMSNSGLLLAFDWGGMRINLTRYREYEPLTPELASR